MEDLLDLIDGDAVDAFARLLVGGVEDQHVQAAQILQRIAHHTFGGTLFKEVDGIGVAAPPGLMDVLQGGLRVLLLLGEMDDGDVGTLPGVSDGHGASDAGVAAGDQGPLALEPAVAHIGLLAVVRVRLGLSGEAGLADVLMGGDSLVVLGPWILLGVVSHADPLLRSFCSGRGRL